MELAAVSELLTPSEAAPLAGVPVAQLERWAWLGVGPRNLGTKLKPLYRDKDIRCWLDMRASKPGKV